jgi:hypothetical protein
MNHPAQLRRTLVRLALTVAIVTAGIGATAAAGQTAGPGPKDQVTGNPLSRDRVGDHDHQLPTKATVKPPKVTAPKALPKPKATAPVPLQRNLKLGSLTPRAVTVAAATDKVALRALIVAFDANDIHLPTWKSTLDRVGAAYDVLYAKSTPLTADQLVGADGVGKYNAILLTDAMLYDASAGTSAFDGTEWNTLWAYERDYKVRQAVVYSSYGSYPEDYCLRQGTEGGVGDTPLQATLTAAGQAAFSDLKSGVKIPIQQSYVYRNTLQAGCAATPIIQTGTSILGVTSTSTDGRERMALSFSNNQYLLQANLLTYGMFRWATRGLYFGEYKHYLMTDVDDWFNSSDQLLANGTYKPEPGFQMTGHDAYNAYQVQTSLRQKYPLASQYTMDMAYNAGDAVMGSNATCYPNGGVNRLTSTTRCLRNNFRWINHTLTHPKLNFSDYNSTLAEINDNLTRGATLGLPTDRQVLKTGEYSGLGVYHPDPNNDIDPPTDHGLMASNPNLIAAAKAAGVKYFHGNMSFNSHKPACFNCGVRHPMDPSLLIVPDWPTNIAYFSTTPEEETYFYNMYYGPNGKFPFFPVNQTYAQLMNFETDVAMQHVATGSAYTHTFHIGNLRDYTYKCSTIIIITTCSSQKKTLMTDWADQVMAKYTSYYKVPLLSPGWTKLADSVAKRNVHFETLTAGARAVYDRTTNTVTVSSPQAGSVTMTGATTAGFTTYGAEKTALINLAANTPVTFTPSILP